MLNKVEFCCRKQKWGEASAVVKIAQDLRKMFHKKTKVVKAGIPQNSLKKGSVYITAAAAYKIRFVSQECPTNRP